MVCAGERAAIDIDGGARWERLAPVTLDNLDCLELICGGHRSICLDLTFAILPPIDGPYATLDLIADRYVLIDALLCERGIEPAVVYRSDGNGTVLAFVAAGTGIALLPELGLDGHDERMCVLDVDGLLARCIGLAWHRERQPSPAARAFMALARSVCRPLGAASAA